MELTQRDHLKVDYPIAVSNRLFRDSVLLKDLPCQNCNLILMGSMACYEEKCPECGKTPPNRSPVWKRLLNLRRYYPAYHCHLIRFEKFPQTCIFTYKIWATHTFIKDHTIIRATRVFTSSTLILFYKQRSNIVFL